MTNQGRVARDEGRETAFVRDHDIECRRGASRDFENGNIHAIIMIPKILRVRVQ